MKLYEVRRIRADGSVRVTTLHRRGMTLELEDDGGIRDLAADSLAGAISSISGLHDIDSDDLTEIVLDEAEATPSAVAACLVLTDPSRPDGLATYIQSDVMAVAGIGTLPVFINGQRWSPALVAGRDAVFVPVDDDDAILKPSLREEWLVVAHAIDSPMMVEVRWRRIGLIRPDLIAIYDGGDELEAHALEVSPYAPESRPEVIANAISEFDKVGLVGRAVIEELIGTKQGSYTGDSLSEAGSPEDVFDVEVDLPESGVESLVERLFESGYSEWITGITDPGSPAAATRARLYAATDD